jgi:hypothetical protein
MHTKGPWKLKNTSADWIRIVGPNGQWVDVGQPCTSTGKLTDEVIANARLIAAAPELLSALRRAFNLIKESGFSSGLIEDEFDATLKQAGDAIAKAEGK